MTAVELSMDTPLKKIYLEQIRNTSVFPSLRLAIDMAFGITTIGVIIGSLRFFIAAHAIQGLFVLASLVVVFAFRGVAVLIVDIADTLLAQRTQAEAKRTGQPSSTATMPL
jgi:hypothetical protein